MADQTFDEFMATTRAAAAAAYVAGDAAPVTAISTRQDPATFFGPGGGRVVGAAAVVETNETGTTTFQPGGETRLDVVHVGDDGALAYWVGLQHATVRLAGRSEPVAMTLRITELFRRGANGWELFHRHADSNAEPDGA